MQRYRTGEEGQPIPARSDRFYKLGDNWFFQIRGGACFGPYTCRREAEEAVKVYFQPAAQSCGKSGGAVIHPFGRQRAKH